MPHPIKATILYSLGWSAQCSSKWSPSLGWTCQAIGMFLRNIFFFWNANSLLWLTRIVKQQQGFQGSRSATFEQVEEQAMKSLSVTPGATEQSMIALQAGDLICLRLTGKIITNLLCLRYCTTDWDIMARINVFRNFCLLSPFMVTNNNY